jgi:hypothetical protein
MSVHSLKSRARKHWEKYLPQKVAELKAQGQYQESLHAAAVLAQEEIEHLMKYQHYSAHEAESEALRHHILLPPEPPPEDDWEAQELAKMEAEYQQTYGRMFVEMYQDEPEDGGESEIVKPQEAPSLPAVQHSERMATGSSMVRSTSMSTDERRSSTTKRRMADSRRNSLSPRASRTTAIPRR